MVFFGEYEVKGTKSGRIALPKKVREVLADKEVVITKGYNNCLAGYNKQEWFKKTEELMSVSLLEREHLEKRRMLFSSTVHLAIDDLGRINIPKKLREFANLDKQVLIIGVGDHFEIWDQASWDEYAKSIE